GIWYLPFSFAMLVVLHDAYFYWMHRLLHHPRLFRWMHLAHHRSNNPTPWASLAFDPLEAVLEIAIVPVLVLVIPLHPTVLLAFATWALAWNVIGHLGYELFPGGWVDHPVLRWLNTSTHHNLHHRYSKGNYGLYFNWWDRWMDTNHPDYERTFRELTSG
ncbi:MAG: sterol desaturase family protein, partial [Lewinella sp.]|nr:sterol desaturase family protein [Lewinella sp.]